MILLGAPGSGKGTQAETITARYDIPHISTGDLFRAALEEESQLGRAVREYIESGRLVPDHVTSELVGARIARSDCRNGFTLDGFPRTHGQVVALDNLLQEFDLRLDAVLYFDLSEETAVERLAGRRICGDCGANYHVRNIPSREPGRCDACGGRLVQRSDDKPETARKRLEVYAQQTQALVTKYERRGLLRRIDADRGPEEVATAVLRVLDELSVRSSA